MDRLATALLAAGCTALLMQCRRRQVAAREAARLRELNVQLGAARLNEHRARVSPHLLLNALNSVAVLAEEENAPRVLDATSRLAQLMRVALEQNTPLTTLRREVAFVERYAAVEQVRFGDRLQLNWEIDPTCLDARVPALLLQPLVENALHHGITPGTGTADVTVGAACEDDRLHMWVRDRGPGLVAGAARDGRGIGMTRRQLELLYGGSYRLTISGNEGGGVEVNVAIPLMTNGARHDDSNAARR